MCGENETGPDLKDRRLGALLVGLGDFEIGMTRFTIDP